MRKDKASTKLGKKKEGRQIQTFKKGAAYYIVLWLSNDNVHVQSHWC